MQQITREKVEDFLYYEAKLLDTWKLEEWGQLFTKDAMYLIPSTDLPDGDYQVDLFLVADNFHKLNGRGKRLLNKQAHVEFPHSKTVHNISNVRIVKETEDGEIHVECNYVAYRSKRDKMDIFPGYHEYRLIVEDGQFRIREKRTIVQLDAIRPHGKISIIL